MSELKISKDPEELAALRQAIVRAGLSSVGAPAADAELRSQIHDALENEDLSETLASTEPAAAALAVLQNDPDLRDLLDGRVPGDRPRDFATLPELLTVTSAALIVLSTYVEFERDKDGRWKFRFLIKPQTDKMKSAIVDLARSVGGVLPK